MKIINLNGYEEKKFETAVALGNFDGIHIGHKYLIEDMVNKAKIKGLRPSVLLFKNHTKTVVGKGENKVYIITSNPQKIDIFNQLGVEVVYTMDFNEGIMKLSSHDFVEKIIKNKLNARLITVGFDYRFGYKASGDSEYLKKLGMKEGFDTNIVKPIYFEGEVVSSTAIRNLIKDGNIKKANEFLGRPYTITGKVIEGKSRGRKLGYPTANIRLDFNYIIPRNGVYETTTLLEGKEYLSLTNIGVNPTFDEGILKLENYIIGFNNNIYGKPIQIKFIEFIRDDIKFNSALELVEQIGKDIEYVKRNQ